MAIRNVVLEGDPILYKKCRIVKNFDARLAQLIDDMIETMQLKNGVGLAASQVGILKRVVVIQTNRISKSSNYRSFWKSGGS